MRRDHIVDGRWQMPGDPLPAIGWPGTRNGATHRVWLPTQVQALLAEMNETGFVFWRPPWWPCRQTPTWGRHAGSLTDLKVERATPHDLRRTHGTKITGLRFTRDAMN